MRVNCRVTSSIKFAGTHLYTWVERGTVRVKCLAQEHNEMFPDRARTQTARSWDEHTDHEATVPPTISTILLLVTCCCMLLTSITEVETLRLCKCTCKSSHVGYLSGFIKDLTGQFPSGCQNKAYWELLSARLLPSLVSKWENIILIHCMSYCKVTGMDWTLLR